MSGSIWGGPPTRSEWEAQNGLFEHRGQINDLINQGLAGLPNRAAPQLDPTQQGQFRQGQMDQVNRLQGIASGQQQGAGELAVQRQMDNALAAQQAMARMRGAGGYGARDAARQSAALGISATGLGQQAALQDQQSANALLSQALGQGRGQDLGLAGQNASLQQQQMSLNDQKYLGLLSQLTGLDIASLQARLQAQQIANQPGIEGPLIGAAGQIIGAGLMRPRAPAPAP